MPTPLQPELDALSGLVLDPDKLVRAVAAGRRRGTTPPWRRVEIRPVELKAGRVLQVVTFDERQAHTSNHAYGPAAAEAVAGLLAEPFGNWHVDTTEGTTSLRVTKKGDAQVHRAAAPPPPVSEEGTPSTNRWNKSATHGAHDRVKRRLLDESHPVFRALGVAGTDGRVKPSRQAKYRQVEDFLRQLAVVLPPVAAPDAVAAPGEGGAGTAHTDQGRLHVVDLGCGNAYLTFGAYAYLADVQRRDVDLVGVDVKAQARERNDALAATLGWGEHLSFVEGAIGDAEVDPPDVVLALHACDTATDDALVRAVRWRAPVVLAAPCCHHDLQKRINVAGAPEPYGLVTRHGLLRERLADVLTDAFRAAVLRMLGYRVDVVEFVDSAHTPRNAMLRAVHTGAPPRPETVREYLELTRAWGVTPYLADALADELRPVLDDAVLGDA